MEHLNHSYMPGFDRKSFKCTERDPRTLGKRKIQEPVVVADPKSSTLPPESNGNKSAGLTFRDRMMQFNRDDMFTKPSPKDKATQTDQEKIIGNDNLKEFLSRLKRCPLDSDKDFNIAVSFTFTMFESLMDYNAKRLPFEEFSSILGPFEEFTTRFHAAMNRIKDSAPSGKKARRSNTYEQNYYEEPHSSGYSDYGQSKNNYDHYDSYE